MGRQSLEWRGWAVWLSGQGCGLWSEAHLGLNPSGSGKSLPFISSVFSVKRRCHQHSLQGTVERATQKHGYSVEPTSSWKAGCP